MTMVALVSLVVATTQVTIALAFSSHSVLHCNDYHIRWKVDRGGCNNNFGYPTTRKRINVLLKRNRFAANRANLLWCHQDGPLDQEGQNNRNDRIKTNCDDDIKQEQKEESNTRRRKEKSTKTRRSFLHSTSSAVTATAASSVIVGGGPVHPNNAAAASEVSSRVSSAAGGSRLIDNSILMPMAPFSTRRKYKSLTLPSGLSVLLVSDRGFIRSNAALSIGGAGQFSDPIDLPGCAHLMEHMTLSGACGDVGGSSDDDNNSFFSSSGIKRRFRMKQWWSKDDRNINDDEDEEYNDMKEADFEEWLGDRDGASNAFTSPDAVCFHFTCPPSVFQETLVRFASLFNPSTIKSTCKKASTLRREVRRIDAELMYGSDAARSFYLLKRRADVRHPFSRFGAGSLDTLERKPRLNGVDVGERLVKFFDEKYRADKAVLVVVSPDSLRSMERWVVPAFSGVLSKGSLLSSSLALPQSSSVDTEERIEEESKSNLVVDAVGPPYPDPYPVSPAYPDKFTQTILLRSRDDPLFNENIEILTMEWPLDLRYDGLDSRQKKDTSMGENNEEKNGGYQVTAPAVGFVISQILGRRGPGGLYLFLQRRGWVPSGTKGVPRLSFPVDVSGFQIMKMEISLTPEGFANRGAVIAAVYKAINAVSRIATPGSSGTGGGPSFLLPRELLLQYVTVSTIHGYALTPRPPDAVELAVDAQIYGIGAPTGVGVTGQWTLMPSTDDSQGIELLRYAVDYALSVMADPLRTMVTITASAKVLSLRKNGIVNAPVPWPPAEPLWTVEPVTGAAYYVENGINLPGLVDPLVWFEDVLGVEGDALGSPVINPLVPARLRAARPVLERISPVSNGGPHYFYLSVEKDKTFWRPFFTPTPLVSMLDAESQNMEKGKLGTATGSSSWEERALAARIGDDWKLWQTGSATITPNVLRLQLPMAPPEPTCRCAFVFQLFSDRPLEATAIQAAHAELWRLSFDDAIIDLAELGAPAGLAYDMTFNGRGLRICFRGISQTLPSYARRFCRRLVDHSMRLNDGLSTISTTTVNLAIDQATRRGGPLAGNPFRRTQLVSELRRSTARDAAEEGFAFLNSCDLGGVALAQGDLLPQEALQLLTDLRTIFKEARASPFRSEKETMQTTSDLQEILYPPFWKPRSSSPCLIPGVPLVSDACGRVKR